MNQRRTLQFAVAGLGLILGGAACAQSWPEKPVRIIVPFPAGGGSEIQARVLGARFQEYTRQTFVVDVRAGASGLIGADLVVSSPPDGYTLLLTTATLSINTTLYGSRMKFSPVTDLAPVSWIASTPLVLVTHPSVPAKSVKELVALAKKNPGYMNAGINVPGSTSHLSAEMLKQMGGLEAVLVPFKGGGSAIISLMSGEIDFLFATGPVTSVALKSGRVRALAVTTAKRAAAFPDLPTMNSFLPGFESDNWYAMFFPAGTPRNIVEKMQEMVVKALRTPEVRGFLEREGLDPIGSTPEELAVQMKREIAKYAEVIRKGNIKLQ
jgi:tripartite-type tricarboxylate transporter receptor subunit TctC